MKRKKIKKKFKTKGELIMEKKVIEKSEACLAVSCPNCEAKKGRLCRDARGNQVKDHVAREKKYQAKRESDELKQPSRLSSNLTDGQGEAAQQQQEEEEKPPTDEELNINNL